MFSVSFIFTRMVITHMILLNQWVLYLSSSGRWELLLFFSCLVLQNQYNTLSSLIFYNYRAEDCGVQKIEKTMQELKVQEWL